VDTAAEKMTETVSRQRFTASDTTHDGEKRIQTITTEKRRKRVSRQETWRSRRIICLFLTFPKLGSLGAGGQTLSAPWRQRADLRASEECGRRSTPDSLRAGALGPGDRFFFDWIRSASGTGGLWIDRPARSRERTAMPGPRSTTEMVWGRASGAWFRFFYSISIGSGDCLI
jgi:hypothetical protein